MLNDKPHPDIEHAIEEIKKTFEDLRETFPGLHIACLLSAPLETQGEVTASFFATGNLDQAAHVMHRLILEQRQELVRARRVPRPEIPEAS